MTFVFIHWRHHDSVPIVNTHRYSGSVELSFRVCVFGFLFRNDDCKLYSKCVMVRYQRQHMINESRQRMEASQARVERNQLDQIICTWTNGTLGHPTNIIAYFLKNNLNSHIWTRSCCCCGFCCCLSFASLLTSQVLCALFDKLISKATPLHTRTHRQIK